MTKDFCDGFVSACGADLALPATYCDEHVLDNTAGATAEYWSYPLDIGGKKRIYYFRVYDRTCSSYSVAHIIQ